eukprot:PhF_6_TR40689/c0_g1_i1/m.61155
MEGSTPTDLKWKHNEDYYNDFIRKSKVCVARVTTDPVKGKCLVATQNISKGDHVLVENALTWSQNMDEYSKGIKICGMCMRCTETPKDILTRALDKSGAKLVQEMPPHPTGRKWTSTSCRNSAKGCTDSYCNAECENRAWTAVHCVTCTALMNKSQRDAWKAFHTEAWHCHGIDYSDTAYVAFKTIALTLAQYRTCGVPLPEAYEKYDMMIKVPWERFTFLYLLSDTEGLSKTAFEKYAANPEEHPTVKGSASGEAPKSVFLNRFVELMSAAYNLNDEEKAFFTPERCSLLMGMILLNGQERTPNSPYTEYSHDLRKHSSDTESAIREFHRKCRAHKSTCISECQGATKGQAIYRIGSCFNHSCDPNVQISYDEENRETLVAVAMRNVAAGEELMISYIDENLSYWHRQLHLYDHYLFTCTCSKCLAEAPSAK